MTLAIYLSRLIGMRVLLALLGLTALMQIVDLLDSTGTLFAAGEGARGMLIYALWRLPAVVEQVLPMAVLAGTLISLFALVRHNEIIAMRAAGVTSYRVLACALPVALVMTMLHFALANRISPWAEPRFAAWWESVEAEARIAEGKPGESGVLPRVWMRVGDTVIAAARDEGDRSGLRDLTVITLDGAGAVQRRLEARTARPDDGGWALHAVRDIRVVDGGFSVARADTAPWPGPVPPDEVAAVVAAPRSLSIGRVTDILRGTTPAAASHAYYRTTLHHGFALLLTAPLMVLLSVPAAFGNARHGGSGRGLLLGALLGVSSLAADGVLTAMGEIGLLPPLLAAWTAPLVFACIGGTILLRLEEP